MGLHDRLSRQQRHGGGRRRLRPRATVAARRAPAGASDPYAELKTRVHHACIAKLGPELFKQDATEDLAERVLRAVTEQLALDRHAAHARGAPPARPRDHRRHPRLRAARAVPPRRHRHRGHGQRLRPGLRRARRQDRARRDAAFVDNAHLLRIIDKIVSQVGRRIDESSPMVDARLPDGSRVNAIIPPLALRGPTLTIRKFSRDPYTMDDLIAFGTLTARSRRSSSSACVRGQAQHPHLRRYRHRQDDDAERALGVRPERRAHRHDRGRGRAPAPAGARDPARVAPAEHRGRGRGPDPRARPQRPAHAPRPDHRRRGPRRRDARHAPGDEHGPRGLADDDPRQHAARRARRGSRRSCSRPASTCRCARSASRSRARST